jgi:hypothetical protein
LDVCSSDKPVDMNVLKGEISHAESTIARFDLC